MFLHGWYTCHFPFVSKLEKPICKICHVSLIITIHQKILFNFFKLSKLLINFLYFLVSILVFLN